MLIDQDEMDVILPVETVTGHAVLQGSLEFNTLGQSTILIFLFGVSRCNQFWDYTSSRTMNCSNNALPSDQQFWTTLTLHDLDRYTFLVVSPFVLLLMVLCVFSYVIKQSRSRPSDIILAISICEMMLIGSAFSQAIYETSHFGPTCPPGFMSFCSTAAIFALMGWLGLNYYNMIFCLALAWSVRNTLKGAFVSNVAYHLLGVLIISLLTVLIYMTNGTGKNIAGMCAIKFSSVAPFVVLCVPILLILLASISIYRFRTGIPKNSFFKNQSVYTFYYIYIFAVIAIQLTITLLNLIGDLNCQSDSPDPALYVSFSFANIMTLIHPLMIAFIRYHHPAVKGTIKKKIYTYFRNRRGSDDIFQDAITDEGEEMEDYNWLGSLLESIRGSQVFSFLTGMLISHIEFEKEVIRNVKAVDYLSHYTFTIKEDSAENYLEKRVNPRESRRVNKQLGGIKPLDYQVTSFCPRVFKYLTNTTGLNLQQSLSILLNSEIIKLVAQVDGGKSGEFFFCSHDFNVLFKTVSEAQTEVYLSNIKEFIDHYHNEENSLISKIIGLYRFRRTDIIDNNVYIILQKNLAMCDRIHIQRVFDLKGSKYNRQTLSEKSVQDLSTVTLKDIDFLKTEQKILISPITSRNIKRILSSDIQFLKSLGVMDYSLLIMKINWDQVAFFKKKKIFQVLPLCTNPFQMIPSEVEQGVYYHFTIIDYLQTWTVVKHAENFLKKVIVREFNESVITAEQPLTYAHRLNKFLEVIF